MAAGHFELVQRAYDAWNRDDVDGALAITHPNVEWRTSGLFPGLEPVYRGHAGVRDFWEALKAPWKYFTITTERSWEAGDNLTVAVRFEAAGEESGAKVELRFVNVWRIENGCVVGFASYPSVEDAVRAGAPGEAT